MNNGYKIHKQMEKQMKSISKERLNELVEYYSKQVNYYSNECKQMSMNNQTKSTSYKYMTALVHDYQAYINLCTSLIDEIDNTK